MTPLVEHAVKLGLRGLPVFPCIPGRKEPLFGDNLMLASCDPIIIRRYWDPTDCNIGIAVGRRAGVWVLDVDGDEGRMTLRKLEAEHRPLPQTVTVITGDNGEHRYFEWPKRGEVRNNPSCEEHEAAFPSLHWRGNGGYTVAPPSIHPNGRRYAWSVDSADRFAVAPDWLIKIVTESRNRVTSIAGQNAVAPLPPGDWEALLARPAHRLASLRGGAKNLRRLAAQVPRSRRRLHLRPMVRRASVRPAARP